MQIKCDEKIVKFKQNNKVKFTQRVARVIL